MSYSGSRQPPPLPPRSQRPGSAVFSNPYEHQTWSYPPPPPGPPPRSPGLSPDTGNAPPPIPPRPPGFEINASVQSNTVSSRPQSMAYTPPSLNGQTYMGIQLPPPPPGPPPKPTVLAYYPPVPPRPQQQQQQIPGSTSYSSHTAQSPWGSGGQTPNGLRTVPPPPSGPPQSPNAYTTPVPSQYEPTSWAPVNIHTRPPNQVPSSEDAAHPVPSLVYPVQSEIPAPPLPPYRPWKETSDTSQTPLAITPSVGISATKNPSPHFPSPTALVQPSPGVLVTSFQYLNVGQAPPVSPRSTITAKASQGLQEKLNSSPFTQNLSQNYSLPPPPPRTTTDELPSSYDTQQNYARSYTLPGPAPFAVTSCIEDLETFETDWYWHPDSPDFLICSKCYVDHIHGTRFWDSFKSERTTDGKPRKCRFSKPRMRDRLFKDAAMSGSLRSVLEWMCFRSSILDCKGVEGGDSSVGIKWYVAKSNAIPNFLSCQACYEDYIVNNQFATLFERSQPQPAGTLWACDVAIPFIKKEHEVKAKLNDWAGFAAEAKARIVANPCPQGNQVTTLGRNWFVPVNSTPETLLLCEACYCDQVIHTGEEPKWARTTELSKSIRHRASCGMSNMNIKIAMAVAHSTKDFSQFWTAVDKLTREKPCAGGGITNGVWYTLPSDPADFGICGACHAGTASPLGASRFFAPKPNVPPGATLRCCLNAQHPRGREFLVRLIAVFFTRDAAAFEAHVSAYATIPPCPRDNGARGLRWYGWPGCTVCPECHHEFARPRVPALEALMTLRGAALEEDRMCEMYSARMRALYGECGGGGTSSSLPDPAPLLAFSARRREVFCETVVPLRVMLFKQRMALEQQKMLNVMSSHYTSSGQMQQTLYGSAYTYSAAGVGSGYANADLLQGAAYGRQAMDVGAGIGSGSVMLTVQQLEQRWREVE